MPTNEEQEATRERGDWPSCGVTPQGWKIACQNPKGHSGPHQYVDAECRVTWEPRCPIVPDPEPSR